MPSGRNFLTLDKEQRFYLLHGFLNGFASVRVEGVHNMPANGGAILVCNHNDYLDTVVQGLYSGRKLTFMAKAELFNGSLFDTLDGLCDELKKLSGQEEWLDLVEELVNAISQTVLDATVLPIIRNYRPGRAAQSAAYYERVMSKVLRLLSSGHVIAIYPEGTRSADGRLQPFKGFAARIALRARVPVVPSSIMGMHGLSDIQRWAEGRNRNRSVIYKIGEPIRPEGFPPDTDKRAVKILTAMMQERVADSLQRRRNGHKLRRFT